MISLKICIFRNFLLIPLGNHLATTVTVILLIRQGDQTNEDSYSNLPFQVCGAVWGKQCLFHPRVQQSVQQGPDKRLQEPAEGCQEPLVRAHWTPSAQAAQKTSWEWETTQKTLPQEALVTDWIHGY